MSFFPRCSPREISTPNLSSRRSYRSCCAPYAPVPTIRTGLSPIYGERVICFSADYVDPQFGAEVGVDFKTFWQALDALFTPPTLVLSCGDVTF